MKTCSYCGKRYADTATRCPTDQQELVPLSPSEGPSATETVICPNCGVADDFRYVVSPRGPFHLLSFFGGGIIAVMFFNAGKKRPARCHQCDQRFLVFRQSAKIYRIIYWLLVLPTILVLIVTIVRIIFSAFR